MWIENSRKTATSASLTMPKPLIMCITTNSGRFFKRWEYQTTLPASRKTCMQAEKQQLEPDMEQRTSSKLGKACIKDVYCHLDYLTSMQSGNESVSHTVMSDSLQPMNCSLPGSSIHRILQARIVEWVAITFSRGSSRPRNQTHSPAMWDLVKFVRQRYTE